MDVSTDATAGPHVTVPPGSDHLRRLLESVVTSASDAVLITEAGALDATEGGPRIVYANEAFAQMTGYATADVLGATPRMLQCEKTDDAALRRIRSSLSRWEPVQEELLNRRKDGTEFWVQVAISPAVDEAGTCTHWVAIQRDVTERRHRELAHEAALRIARRRLRTAFEHAPIGMAVASPAGVLLAVNPALAALLGHAAEDLAGRTLFEITHSEDRGAAVDACKALSAAGGTSRMECRFEHASGRCMDVVVNASLVAEGGAPDHVILHVEDVSDRTALQHELVRRALHDDLTRLPNRAMLLDRLAKAVARRNRDGSAITVLFVDVDGFKAVNDQLGHAVGDELLVALAERLEQAVRPGDTVARFGGDEFVVMCERTDTAAASIVASRLARAASRPIVSGAGELRPSVSLGMAVAAGPSRVTPDTLIQDADAAMYAAKADGHGRAVVFDAAMRERDSARRAVTDELRTALHDGELLLHFQAQRDLQGDGLTGVEALVRWEHPQRGLLAPRDFIPAAEHSGLIDELGTWVLRRACAVAVATPDIPVIWVNVSARQLRPSFVDDVRAALRLTGLPAGRVGLELTESVLMQDLTFAKALLGGLRDLGVRLAIDDFGTGYSSLAYLAELPVDTVKVDRSFTARLGRDGRGRHLIVAILGLARGLELDVVVEGVETEDQLTALRAMGARQAQGHLLGPPTAHLPLP